MVNTPTPISKALSEFLSWMHEETTWASTRSSLRSLLR